MAISTSRPTPSTRSPARPRAGSAACRGKSSKWTVLPCPFARPHLETDLQPHLQSFTGKWTITTIHSTQYTLCVPGVTFDSSPAQSWCSCPLFYQDNRHHLSLSPSLLHLSRTGYAGPTLLSSNIDGQCMCDSRLWPVPSECT